MNWQHCFSSVYVALLTRCFTLPLLLLLIIIIINPRGSHAPGRLLRLLLPRVLLLLVWSVLGLPGCLPCGWRLAVYH